MESGYFSFVKNMTSLAVQLNFTLNLNNSDSDVDELNAQFESNDAVVFRTVRHDKSRRGECSRKLRSRFGGSNVLQDVGANRYFNDAIEWFYNENLNREELKMKLCKKYFPRQYGMGHFDGHYKMNGRVVDFLYNNFGEDDE